MRENETIKMRERERERERVKERHDMCELKRMRDRKKVNESIRKSECKT